MIVLFVDNLFFYLGGQSVSCKASLAALLLYGYFCDIVVMMLLSENKYDDDDDCWKFYPKSNSHGRRGHGGPVDWSLMGTTVFLMRM